MFKTINEGRQYLALHNVSVLGLDSIKNLLSYLSHPEKNLKFIHIAGTNGKGSCCSFISNILLASGYKVGTYCSPAVFEENEIIKVNNVNISDKDFLQCLHIVQEAVCKMIADGLEPPTKFEMETAIAFLYFLHSKVDFVVMETGLGGDTDATNAVENTLISVITKISLDHIGILGDTLSDIAKVKSGIIKKDSIVVSGVQKQEVLEVIKNKAKSVNARLVTAGSGKDYVEM